MPCGLRWPRVYTSGCQPAPGSVAAGLPGHGAPVEVIRSTLPARFPRSAGADGMTASPVVTHRSPAGPKATRQPWWRLPEPDGMPVTTGVASLRPLSPTPTVKRTTRTSVAEVWQT